MKLKISYKGISIFQEDKPQWSNTELKGFSGTHVNSFVHKVLSTTTLLI